MARRWGKQPAGVRTVVSFGDKEVTFRSRFEAAVAVDVSNRASAWAYEPERWKYTQTRHYTPDLAIRTRSGKTIWIEAKGHFEASDRTKMIDVRNQNEDRDIRFIFQNPDLKLGGGSKTTYGTWATKHGFKWASGTVPDHWLEE